MEKNHKLFLFLIGILIIISLSGIFFAYQWQEAEKQLKGEKNKVKDLSIEIKKLEKQIKDLRTLKPEIGKIDYSGPNKILFYLNDHNISIINADGSERKKIAKGFPVSLSPDNSKIVYRKTYKDTDEVLVFDLTKDEIISTAKIPVYCDGYYVLDGFGWSPDSQNVAYTLVPYGMDVGPGEPCTWEGEGTYVINLKNNEIKPWLSLSDETEILFDKYKKEAGVCKEEHYIRKDKTGNLWNKNQQLTFYKKHPDIYPQAFESVSDFIVSLDCSKIVYKVRRSWLPPLPPHTGEELEYYNETLHVIDIDGKNDLLLTTYVGDFHLTPDGQEIVFWDGERGTNAPPNGIYVIDINGMNKQKITEAKLVFAGALLVSPDGQQVAFAADDGIYTVNIDGTDQKKIVEIEEPSLRGSGLLEWR